MHELRAWLHIEGLKGISMCPFGQLSGNLGLMIHTHGLSAADTGGVACTSL